MNGLIKQAYSHWQFLKQRLAKNPDPEQEQAFKLRLTIGLVLVAYFCFPWAENESFLASITTLQSVMALMYYSAAIVIAAAIVIKPTVSPVRRVVSNAIDLISLSVVMFFAGSESVFLFVLYLWVILGSGFRYGTTYLYISQAIGIIGFTICITWGQYWQDIQHQPIGLSLLILIILIPLYTAFLIKKLHSAIEAAKFANEAKSRFLASMSHELRTPLNGVIGIADLMRETELSAEQKEFVRIMQNSANTLLGLIENVLDISKIEAGKIESHVSEFDIHGLTTTVVKMQRSMAESKNITLFCNVDPEIQFTVEGDPQHLRQVLINLIGNAIKFTREGFVRLSLKKMNADDDTQVVRFEVADTGIGIPSEALETIFNDFTQVHTENSNISGTGLGTTISKELVELMGGSIGVNSQLGEGTTFWFELPFKVSDNNTMTLENHNILILSNENQYQSLNDMMQIWGVHPDWVDNSAKALARLIQAAESSEPYSTMIVDSDVMLDIAPAKYAEMVKSDKSLHDLSLILINKTEAYISEEINNHYISVINSNTSKTGLFNALHAAQSSLTEHENIVRLADFYADQGHAQSLHILISEDNRVNQQVLQGILHQAGHKTLLAENGEQALDMITEQGDQIDLIILDMNMPGMSGLEVLKAFRFIDTSASTPVIMLTADATPEAQNNCEEAGANAFLTKPINSRSLLETISQLSLGLNKGTVIESVTETGSEQSGLLDQEAIKQLSSLGDQNFLQTLIDSFKHDAKKHIALIKNHCRDDYLSYRESLHALKGSATEMSAVKLADACASAEAIKPDELGQSHVLTLTAEIAAIFDETIMQLEQLANTELHDSHRDRS